MLWLAWVLKMRAHCLRSRNTWLYELLFSWSNKLLWSKTASWRKFMLAYSSGGFQRTRVFNRGGKGMQAWGGGSLKRRKGRRTKEQEVGQGNNNPPPLQNPCSKAAPPKGSTASSSSATTGGQCSACVSLWGTLSLHYHINVTFAFCISVALEFWWRFPCCF